MKKSIKRKIIALLSIFLSVSLLYGNNFVFAEDNVNESTQNTETNVENDNNDLTPSDDEKTTDEEVKENEEGIQSTEENNIKSDEKSVKKDSLTPKKEAGEAEEEKTLGAFKVKGGTQGVDYEYKNVTHYIQGYANAGNIEGGAITFPYKYGAQIAVTLKSLVINTSKHLTISTTATSSEGIYIKPGNHANITFNNVNITSYLPFDIPTNTNKTSVHLILADGSHNNLTAKLGNTTYQFPGLRCGEGSELTIDDARINEDTDGNFVAPKLGKVSRDATLKDGTVVKAGDRLTLLDSTNPGTLTVNGGYRASAIGGGAIENSGNMTFNGGIVNAHAYGPNEGQYGAGCGIGGGHAGGGTTMTFNGGKIDATGSYHGAGVGGGCTYVGGMSPTVTYALVDAIKCKTPRSTIAGDININGGFLKSTGYTHSNAFGQGCGGTNRGKNIIITGGTLLPAAVGQQAGFYDIGGREGDVYVLGGSIRLSAPGKFQSSSNDGSAWGDMGKKTKVFMTTINLSGYGSQLRNALVDNLNMKVNGVSTDYGMPSYTDEKSCLYFWLPNKGAGTEVSVDLDVLNNETGKVEPTNPFYVTDAKQGSVLKQYVNFKIDDSKLTDNERLQKRYDGQAFTADQVKKFLSKITGDGIPVNLPENGKLTNSNLMTIQSQMLKTLEDGSLVLAEDKEQKNGTQADVGKYQLTITSSEYSSDPNFGNAFWGHRGEYKYAEITPADSTTSLSYTRNGDKANNTITLTANVSPKVGEAKGCASPTGKVQFYINGKPYGEPVELKSAGNAINSDGYHYSTATINWTPNENDGEFFEYDNEKISVKYLAGDETNYTKSEAETHIIEVKPLDPEPDKEDIKIKKNATNLTDKEEGAPTQVWDRIKYSITLTNELPCSKWGDMEIYDILPIGLELDLDSMKLIKTNGDVEKIPAKAYDPETREIRWTVGDVLGGESYQFEFEIIVTAEVVKPLKDGEKSLDIGNIGHAVGTKPSGGSFEVESEITYPSPTDKEKGIIPGDPGDGAGMKKTAVNHNNPTNKTQVNDFITYTITAENTKEGTVWTDVVIHDEIPEGLNLDTSSINLVYPNGDVQNLSPNVYNEKTRTLSVYVGDVNGKEKYELKFNIIVGVEAIGKDIGNEAYVAGGKPDGNYPSGGGDNPGGDNPGGDNPGGDNPGGDNPGGTTPGGDNPGGTTPGGELKPGDPYFPGDGSDTPAGGDGEDDIIIEKTPEPVYPTDKDKTDPGVLPDNPEPTLDKEVVNETHPSGNTHDQDVLTYTIKLSNPTPGSVWRNVIMFDRIPTALKVDPKSFVLTHPNGKKERLSASKVLKGNMIIVPIPVLNGGETYVLIYKMKVNVKDADEDTKGEEIVNEVSATGDNPDGTNTPLTKGPKASVAIKGVEASVAIKGAEVGPKTNDPTHIWMWAIMMAISGCIISIEYYDRKRRRS